MGGMLETLLSAPTATLLLAVGLALLTVGAVGNIAGKIAPDRAGRVASGAIGAALLTLGLWLQRLGPPQIAVVPTVSTPGPVASSVGPTPEQASPPSSPAARPTAVSGTAPTAAPAPAPPGKVLVTDVTGRVTALEADTFRIDLTLQLLLDSGLAISVDRLRGIEVPNPGRDPLRLVITLSNGQVFTENLSGFHTVFGEADVGRFQLPIGQVQRVQFAR